PNIVVIIADDVGTDMIGMYAPQPQEPVPNPAPPFAAPATPNIDSLAASGVLFRNAWSGPVCAPTRATIQTGRYSFRNAVYLAATPLPSSEMTLAAILDQHAPSQFAFATAMIGKWGLGSEQSPQLAGYDFFEGFLGATGDYTVEGKYSTKKYVDDALTWIN